MEIKELMQILENDYKENKDFVKMLLKGKKVQKKD